LPDVELCSKLDNEMSIYEAKRTGSGALTYSHPKGLHDDYVDSLLMANLARQRWLFPTSDIYTPDNEWDKSKPSDLVGMPMHLIQQQYPIDEEDGW
jgi:hypothetical protein